jgi:hypothetical protein
MPNMSILMSNTAAALDKMKLASTDLKLLQQYAQETRSDYCTGCTAICEAAVGRTVPIGRVMRCLMYSRSYGDHGHAVKEFNSIPADVRRRISGQDYEAAEKKCPRNIAIGRLMREALDELG